MAIFRLKRPVNGNTVYTNGLPDPRFDENGVMKPDSLFGDNSLAIPGQNLNFNIVPDHDPYSSAVTINGQPMQSPGYDAYRNPGSQDLELDFQPNPVTADTGGGANGSNKGNVGGFSPGEQQSGGVDDMSFGNNLATFSTILGQSVGNARSGYGSAKNTAQGVIAGIGLGAGLISQGLSLYRNGAAASATAQRNNWLDQENKKKLANARQGQVTFAADGGLIFNDERPIVPVTGPSGEFIAPKKGDVNVVAEEGEVASIPGDELTKDFLGDKHGEGGTPTMVPNGTRILSDRRKLTDKQAELIRDRFGVKVSSKNTYAEAAEKYKTKIGLNSALDEMAKLTEKLEKNHKNVKDKNTARLNDSILSDHMSEVQKQIDDLSVQDSIFFDVLYDYQESEKKGQLSQYYFGEGGKVDMKMFEESRKKFGLSEEEAKEYFLKKAMMFADGGQYLEFVPVYNSRRTENETYGNNGYQPLINGTYGRVSEWGADAIAEMARLFPELTRGTNKVINIDDKGNASWTDPSNPTGNAKAIENVVNASYRGLRSLSDQISNFDDARNFLIYDFSAGSEQGPDPKGGTGYAHNERTAEGRLGEYHMTRSAAGLRVVTPEQLEELNKRGIRNFSDVLADPNKAKEVLSNEEYERLVSLKNGEGREGLDFVLMSYGLMADPLKAPSFDRQDPKRLDINDLDKLDPKTGNKPLPEVKPEVKEDRKGSRSVGRTVDGFPALFGLNMTMQPSAMDPEYLNQVRMMKAEPVLRTADEVVAGINAGTNAQIRSLNDIAEPGRYAALASIGAQRNEAIGRAISEVDLFNAEQRNRADELNEQRYMNVEQINAALRDQYQQNILQNKAASEDAWFSYFQNLRDQQLAEDEVRIKARILSNIYPDVSTSGRVAVDPNFSGGLNAQRLKEMYNVPDENMKKRTSAKKKS